MTTHWPTTCQDLLHRMRRGVSSEAWPEFVSEYNDSLKRLCLRNGVSASDVPDVMQQIYIQLMTAISRIEFDESKGRFRCWLTTIARRSIWKHLRTQARFPASSPVDEATLAGSDDGLDEIRISRLVRQSLENLRLRFEEEEWQIFQRVFFLDEPRNQVAIEFQKTVGSIYQITFRMKRALEDELERLANDSIFSPR